MAQTMSMGQAAGLAATLSLDEDIAAHVLDIAALQSKLLETGTILEVPNSLADTSRNGWRYNFR